VSAKPALEIFSHQEQHHLDLVWLTERACAALPWCLEVKKAVDAPLAMLSEVEVSIVSDAEIARVHDEFMDDPTATDVITFHHGEIIVSADTAARCGPEHGLTLHHELLLYVIHGLLHLAGWDDHDEAERTLMHGHQERILARLLEGIHHEVEAR
jgi:probable rRNA maturation factor